jgi:hypothetical protein
MGRAEVTTASFDPSEPGPYRIEAFASRLVVVTWVALPDVPDRERGSRDG